jgi:hypothetical protein
MAEEIRTNQPCLLESFAKAYDQLNRGAFNNAERDHTASSRFIQFNGHDPVARVGVTQAVIVGNQNAILWTDHRLLPDRT